MTNAGQSPWPDPQPPSRDWSIAPEVLHQAAQSTPPSQRFGRFELLAQLGQGGMGAVYRARDPELGRDVAIKIVRPGRLSAKAQERLLREGQALATLRHPNVMRIHGVGVEADCPYLVCELIEGGRDLDAVFAEREPEERVALVREAARGLAAAHAVGLVHRDVKPANVVVDRDDHVRVIDFGLVAGEGLERMTGTGALVGTPTHMAPEQIQGVPAGPATDVWALGVLLYQALTDELPFQAPTLVELSGLILNVEPAPPSLLVPDVPRGLEAVCLQALSKDVIDRFPDAAAFGQALDDAPRRSSLARLGPLLIPTVGVVGLGLGVGLWLLGARPAAPRSGPPATATSTGTIDDRPLASPPSADPPADADLAAGQAALTRRDVAAARAAFTRVLKRRPRSVEALIGRSKAHMVQKDRAAARDDADAAVEIAPDDLAARLLRADLRMILENPRGALEDLDRAIQIDPKRAHTYVQRGQVLTVLALDRRALLDFATALDLEPNSIHALWGRGQNLLLSGKPDEALRDFNRVLDLDPEHRGSRVRRAKVFVGRGMLREARADLDHVLAAEPEHAGALIERALVLTKLGQPQAALRDGNAAVRVAPRQGAAWAHRAHAKMLLRDLDGALLDYKQGLEFDPKMAGAWAMVGNIRTMKKDLPGALKALTRSLEHGPEQGSIWFNRGRVQAMLGDYRAAASDFSAAMAKLSPSDHTWSEAKRLRTQALRWAANPPRNRPTPGR